jgi:adenylate kinase
MGDMMRAEIASRSKLGRLLKGYNDEGTLCPDEHSVAMLEARLAEDDAVRGGFILDGFPRTTAQAKALEAVAPPLQLVLNIVVPDEHVVAKLLGRLGCDACGRSYNTADVCDAERGVFMPPILPDPANAKSRAPAAFVRAFMAAAGWCECGGQLRSRSDDTAEVIERRLALYHAETAPLVDYYREQGLLAEYRVRYGVGDMVGLEAELRALLQVA